MRHRLKVKKLNRKKDARLALKRSLALGLIEQGSIVTTLPKAKFLRPFLEKLLTLAKKGDLAAHRLVIARLGNKPLAAKRLREHWAPKFKGVGGGYLRITKLGPRQRDQAEMARVEFTASPKKVLQEKKANKS